MNTLTLTQFDRDAQHARDDWTLALREARDAAMVRHDCPECGGGMNGMYWVPRESVTPEDGVFYRHGDGAGHDLYVTCWQCNPGKNPARGYEVVTLAWIRAWLAAPCQCNDCKRERMDNYAPADGDGKRGAERMYR